MTNQGENRSQGSQSGQDVSQSGNESNSSDDTYMPSEEEGSWYEFMLESASDSDSMNYWHYGPWEVLMQPYYSSSESTEAPNGYEYHNSSSQQPPNEVSNGHQQPNPPAGQQTNGANNSQGSRSAEQPSPNEQQPLDPTLTMVHNLLSQVLRSQDPDEADTWMQRLDKNFAATRCPTKFKKDVTVYYLEKEALGWWNSVDRQTNHAIITWEAFQKEFRRKYFPLEARDRYKKTPDLTRQEWWQSSHKVEFRKLVILEEGHDNSTIYQGIRPSNGVSLVSAMRVKQHLIEGSAYLVAISVVEEKTSSEEKIEEISIVNEFEDVFKSLTELPPPRSNLFTINLIPRAAPIA
ncbi:unnamed protein product [Microthlaspi erraticum]|uniref:Retrotransposon gag domain-containing protein n=1 Tax=Microthlaspi erraticum TaxID=1685480 RepID=A0A6D2HXT1_9BRAS|nr:unnamed protein product [Microthlaspi erraticum]